jgi:hypothetical protein
MHGLSHSATSFYVGVVYGGQLKASLSPGLPGYFAGEPLKEANNEFCR